MQAILTWAEDKLKGKIHEIGGKALVVAASTSTAVTPSTPQPKSMEEHTDPHKTSGSSNHADDETVKEEEGSEIELRAEQEVDRGVAQHTSQKAEHQAEKVYVSITDTSERKPKSAQNLAPLIRKTRRAVIEGQWW